MKDIINLLNIPEESMLNKPIPKEKIYSKEQSETLGIENVCLFAVIKPEVNNVEKVIDENRRYEEIMIIGITISIQDDIYGILKCIFKKIAYPVLVVLEYQGKYKLCTCRFTPGKNDYNENILSSIVFTSWIHSDLLSDKTQKCIGMISDAWKEKNLYEMYNKIKSAVCFAQAVNISKKHTGGIMEFLGIDDADATTALKYCTPYKNNTDKNRPNKYESKKTKSFIWRYDTEDIWYGLQHCEATKKVLENRRYRTIEELLFNVDTWLEFE